MLKFYESHLSVAFLRSPTMRWRNVGSSKRMMITHDRYSCQILQSDARYVVKSSQRIGVRRAKGNSSRVLSVYWTLNLALTHRKLSLSSDAILGCYVVWAISKWAGEGMIFDGHGTRICIHSWHLELAFRMQALEYGFLMIQYRMRLSDRPPDSCRSAWWCTRYDRI